MEASGVDSPADGIELLCEFDRLLGVKEWPVARGGASPLTAASRSETGEDAPVVARRAAKSTAKTKPDADLESRLKAVIEAFPPELADPPGAEGERPDLMCSGRHALKGSPVEVVQRRVEALARQAEQVRGCNRCGLDQTCTQKVFGIGHPDTRLVFVGEAPGADEDRMGYPFVGKAGRLLTAMIEKGMGLRREHVYICNVLKCRPPDNRTPSVDEMAACQDHLWAQLSVLEPELIVALGAPATQTLLATRDSLGRRRGQFFEVHLSGSDLTGGPVAQCLPTYHPAYLLRAPDQKKKTWEDLKKVMAVMGIGNAGT